MSDTQVMQKLITKITESRANYEFLHDKYHTDKRVKCCCKSIIDELTVILEYKNSLFQL